MDVAISYYLLKLIRQVTYNAHFRLMIILSSELTIAYYIAAVTIFATH